MNPSPENRTSEMAQPDNPTPGVATPSTFRRYGVALLCAAGAVFLRWLLDPIVGSQLPLASIYGFVAVAVWYGGWMPAALTTVLSYFVANWLFIHPKFVFNFSDIELWRGGMYLFSNGVLIVVGEAMRRAQHRAHRHASVATERQRKLEAEVVERKRVEEALRESELSFRTLTEVSPQVVWTTDATGHVTYINRYWVEYTGLTLKELQRLPPGTPLHPADHAPVMAAWAHSLKTGEPFSAEQRLRSNDGSYRWFLGSGTPVRNERGDIEQWMGICVDINERKRSEELLREQMAALRKSEQHLELLSNTVPALIFYLGPDRRFRTCNDAFTAWFGRYREQIIGLHVRELVGEVAWDIIQSRLEQAYAGDTVEYETEMPYRLGGTRWVHPVYTPHCDSDGTVLGVVALVTDITSAKKIEQDLLRSEERLRAFAEQLERRVTERTEELEQSQDRLRALATELNLAELRERKRLAIELHDHLQQMLVLGKIKLGQGKRLAEQLPACAALIKETDVVLSDALKYTRTLVAELNPPVLNEHGLAGGLKWLAEYMKKHDIAVRVEVLETDLKLPEDQAALVFQSVRELLINSAKHAGIGHATVTLERREGAALITVRDEGVGFDLAAAADTPNGGISSKFGLFSIRERMCALADPLTFIPLRVRARRQRSACRWPRLSRRNE